MTLFHLAFRHVINVAPLEVWKAPGRNLKKPTFPEN
jgi:hypothetical protein